MKLGYLIIGIIIAISCSQEKENKLEDLSKHKSYNRDIILELDADLKSEIFLKDLDENYEVIPLETTKEGLVGQIEKIRSSDSLIFVFDKFINKGILVFDMNGQYLRKIGSIGRGPGQLVQPQCFLVDKKKKLIEIYDASLYQVLVYNFEGNFIHSKNFPFLFTYFEKSEGQYFLYTRKLENYINENHLNFNLLVVDTSFVLQSTYLPYDRSRIKNGRAMGLVNPIVNVNGRVYISEFLNDTTYTFLSGQLRPYKVINYVSNKVPISYTFLNSEELIEKMNSDHPYHSYHTLHSISNNILFYTYSTGKVLDLVNRDITPQKYAFHNNIDKSTKVYSKIYSKKLGCYLKNPIGYVNNKIAFKLEAHDIDPVFFGDFNSSTFKLQNPVLILVDFSKLFEK